MNTPKIKFLGMKFLRIALKSQHNLARVVLQNRQEIDLLVPEQGGIWAILNKTCCFWVNTSSQVKKVSQSSRKTSISYWMSKNELENSQVATITGGYFSWWWRIWSWLMPLLIPAIIILMLLMIVPCIINCLTQFFSVQVNMLQHAVTVQQGYINLQATMENITHLETSKGGRPNAPRCPSLAGNSQRDLNTPIPKELGISTLEGGMLGS